jgi:hypothetical protein
MYMRLRAQCADAWPRAGTSVAFFCAQRASRRAVAAIPVPNGRAERRVLA